MKTDTAVLTVIALLALLFVATPAEAVPPCTQQNAQAACSFYCESWNLGLCADATVSGCEFVYTCQLGGGNRSDCSCGSGCFLAGTKITMADGTLKAIEEIEVGDVILAYDEETGEMKPDKVKQVHDPVQSDSHLVVNETIRLTKEHPVLHAGSWTEIGDLKVGDTLTRADGSLVKIESIEVVQEHTMVYNFAVNPFETYVADGIIVHNKPPRHEIDTP